MKVPGGGCVCGDGFNPPPQWDGYMQWRARGWVPGEVLCALLVGVLTLEVERK